MCCAREQLRFAGAANLHDGSLRLKGCSVCLGLCSAILAGVAHASSTPPPPLACARKGEVEEAQSRCSTKNVGNRVRFAHVCDCVSCKYGNPPPVDALVGPISVIYQENSFEMRKWSWGPWALVPRKRVQQVFCSGNPESPHLRRTCRRRI